MAEEKSMTVKGHLGYLGIIPMMVSPHDPRPLVEQLNEGYAHGGGWNDFAGFIVSQHGSQYVIQYPEDPPYVERARLTMNGETLVAFDHGWVLVIQKDGTQRIARMD